MSVIVVVRAEDRCVMAADSMMSSVHGSKAQMKGSKIHRFHDVLMGSDGTFVISQFIDHHLDGVLRGPGPSMAPLQPEGSLAAWLATAFVPALWRYLKEVELLDRRDQRGVDLPGTVLAAWKDQFALVDYPGTVVEFDRRYEAIGSGAAEARGALHAWYLEPGDNFEAAAMEAVEAACEHDTACGPPVTVEWTMP